MQKEREKKKLKLNSGHTSRLPTNQPSWNEGNESFNNFFFSTSVLCCVISWKFNAFLFSTYEKLFLVLHNLLFTYIYPTYIWKFLRLYLASRGKQKSQFSRNKRLFFESLGLCSSHNLNDVFLLIFTQGSRVEFFGSKFLLHFYMFYRSLQQLNMSPLTSPQDWKLKKIQL